MTNNVGHLLRCFCPFVDLFCEHESHSVVFNSLRPHGLYSPWNSPGQNTQSGQPFLFPRDLPNPGIEPRSPALQADSLPAQPQREAPLVHWSLYLFSLLKQTKRNRIRHKCLYSHIHSLPMYIPHLLCIRDWRRNGVHSDETSRTVVKLKIWGQGLQWQL